MLLFHIFFMSEPIYLNHTFIQLIGRSTSESLFFMKIASSFCRIYRKEYLILYGLVKLWLIIILLILLLIYTIFRHNVKDESYYVALDAISEDWYVTKNIINYKLYLHSTVWIIFISCVSATQYFSYSIGKTNCGRPLAYQVTYSELIWKY